MEIEMRLIGFVRNEVKDKKMRVFLNGSIV